MNELEQSVCQFDGDCAAEAKCVYKTGFQMNRNSGQSKFTDTDKRCECQGGTFGNGSYCEDIDECEKGFYDCPRNFKCVNTIGSYKCSRQISADPGRGQDS